MAHDEYLFLPAEVFDKVRRRVCVSCAICRDLLTLRQSVGVEHATSVLQYNLRYRRLRRERVNGHVAGDATYPRQELTLHYSDRPDGVHRLDKCFLKQVFCLITVLYDQVNGRINSRFVTMEEH